MTRIGTENCSGSDPPISRPTSFPFFLTSPTESPTTEEGDDGYRKYADGAIHNLTPPEGWPEYNNVVLTEGSTLNVESGVAIRAIGIDYAESAILVSQSSLKIQGSEIIVIGSSHVDNSVGEFGGHAIKFLEGSKGRIGCNDFVQPPRTCMMGPSVLDPSLSDCGSDDYYCQLPPGACRSRAGILKGRCTKKPDVCIEIWNPVCGCDIQTYSNSCHAEMEGASELYKGECASEKPCPEGQCRSPEGVCGAAIKCADPCLEMRCGEGEECMAHCCKAVCVRTEEPTMEENLGVTPRDHCDDNEIYIVGGEGNPESAAGDGRGGDALKVYGQETLVEINGATFRAGGGSIQGKSLEIAEAEVKIDSANMDGEILIAKGGMLHIYGGVYTNTIEVLGDASAVEFYGCFGENIGTKQGDGFVEYVFEYSGDGETMKHLVRVHVHEGGEMTRIGTENCEGLEPPS
eukprot:CAMPEP_0183761842 /NCGR_PEP_ID=MMETSP0739-20130205/8683_1 /TAXON_ID=385413 /ORGANISM="Thalassiosira miniscula, Strain CCMP1093" /LENGTH=459 /DNA_ID=CAMNT_0026000045 /DNA_START=3 /DNA_END=1382 /DNA_ORIENTATION=+